MCGIPVSVVGQEHRVRTNANGPVWYHVVCTFPGCTLKHDERTVESRNDTPVYIMSDQADLGHVETLDEVASKRRQLVVQSVIIKILVVVTDQQITGVPQYTRLADIAEEPRHVFITNQIIHLDDIVCIGRSTVLEMPENSHQHLVHVHVVTSVYDCGCTVQPDLVAEQPGPHVDRNLWWTVYVAPVT